MSAQGTKATATLRSSKGFLPAARSGDVKKMRELLAYGANIERRNKDGETPLMLATGFPTTDCLSLLLEHRADIHAKSKSGDTAIARACYHGQLENVRMLLDHGADVDVKDNSGTTPLMNASMSRKVSCVALLLERGAAPMSTCDKGRTAADYTNNEEIKSMIHEASLKNDYILK